jgi:hypothetical protein
MTTAADIIALSLKDIGVLDAHETPDANMMKDALTTLNQMLAQWQISSNYIYAQTDVTFNPSGAITYTIGTGGTINVSTPPNIDYAFYRINDQDFPIEILGSFEEYQEGIGLKNIGTGAFPECLYFNPSYPLGVIYIYPTPATGTIHLGVPTQLPNYTASANALTLPPEYELAIRFSLDEILAAMFGTSLRPDIQQLAIKTRRQMKLNNFRMSPVKTSFTGDGLSNYGRILRG